MEGRRSTNRDKSNKETGRNKTKGKTHVTEERKKRQEHSKGVKKRQV